MSQAVEQLEKQSFEVEQMHVKEMEINFCIHCDYCLENKECVFDDSMEEVYGYISDCEGIILATPVYNNGVSAQLKALIDRTRALFAREPNALKGKAGMGISVGGDRTGGQETALMQIHNFFILNKAIPVGGGAFGANLGASFWSKDKKKEVKKDKEGFKTLKKSINRFMEVLEKHE